MEIARVMKVGKSIGRPAWGVLEGAMQSWSPELLSVLRVVVTYLFLQHGTAKLFHVPHIAIFDQLRLLSRDGFAGMIEIVGSLLLILGLFTRPVAFVLSGEMAIGYFWVHAAQGHFFMPALNGGEEAVLYCFTFLFLSTAGAGPWSLDALLARK
jgi:putative oxidoreductase